MSNQIDWRPVISAVLGACSWPIDEASGMDDLRPTADLATADRSRLSELAEAQGEGKLTAALSASDMAIIKKGSSSFDDPEYDYDLQLALESAIPAALGQLMPSAPPVSVGAHVDNRDDGFVTITTKVGNTTHTSTIEAYLDYVKTWGDFFKHVETVARAVVGA